MVRQRGSNQKKTRALFLIFLSLCGIVRCVFSVFGGYSTKKRDRDIQGHHPVNECEPYEKSVKTKNNIAHCGQKDLGRSGTSREGQQQKKTRVKKHKHQEQTKKTILFATQG